MTCWEGSWVARARITPAARPRATRSRDRPAKVSRWVLVPTVAEK
jgi:hypothetical protein